MIEERETEGTERGHIKIKSKKELFTETDEVKLETRNIRERASHGFPSRLEMGSVTGSKLNESRNIESIPREGSCMKVLPKEKTSGSECTLAVFQQIMCLRLCGSQECRGLSPLRCNPNWHSRV